MNKTINKLVTIFEELFLICCSINITSLFKRHARSPRNQGGLSTQGGGEHVKIAYQFHAASTRRDKNTRLAWKRSRTYVLSLLTEGMQERSRGTKDQLLIDKQILREARIKKRCLAMGWIDYRKAYDMVPHSWIVEMLELVNVADNVKGLFCGSMRDWKSVLTSNGKVLGEVRIKRGIFQGYSLSPLLFVLSMIPLTILLRRENIGYKFGKEQKMMNHLLYMDDLKLYGRSEQELEICCLGFL